MADTKHYMDNNQIIQAVYDWDSDTIKTSMVEGQELSFKLDAKEDSVTTMVASVTVMPGETIACANMRRMAIFVFSGDVEVSISPLDEGDKFISVIKGVSQAGPNGEEPKAVMEVFELVARRVKLVATGDAYLVVQG